jgi:preprotein translocase SecE subunit
MTSRAVAVKPSGNRFTRFAGGIWAEMKKVVWLSRREATYLTLLVLGATVATGIVLYAFDTGFSLAIDKLILGR